MTEVLKNLHADKSDSITVAQAVIHEGRILVAQVTGRRRGASTQIELGLSVWERGSTPGILSTSFGPAGWHGYECIERVARRTKAAMTRGVMQSRVILDVAVFRLVESSPKLYGYTPGDGEARAAADRIIEALDADMVRRFPELFTAAIRMPGGAA
jgi:hypothetical protein